MKKSQFQTTAKELVADEFSRKSYSYALIIIGLMIVGVGFFWTLLPFEVPLYYSKPWGESRLSPKLGLLLLPGLSISVLLINVAISKILQSENVMLIKSLAGATLVISSMFLLSLLGILWSIL